VVCQDGKVSEAAAFLLLRHKIDAMILSGGMESLAAYAPSPEITSESENEALLSGEGRVESDDRKQSANILEDQVSVLKLENEALKSVNQQLNDKCIKLEFDKQHAEKQCRILHKQMEKLTQVLDKLKGG
ncbi:MAG: Crp/Fnr family transcriptional regulator, partial [Methylobacter sp.]